jgi:hypothetical protein
MLLLKFLHNFLNVLAQIANEMGLQKNCSRKITETYDSRLIWREHIFTIGSNWE